MVHRRSRAELRQRLRSHHSIMKNALTLGGKLQPSTRVSLAADYTRSNSELQDGSIATYDVGLSMKYTFSPRMFVNALVRYNRDKGQVDSHIRFRLLSSPTGGLFFVYNEQQDVQNKSTDRVVAFKYTYELRGPFLAPTPSRSGRSCPSPSGRRNFGDPPSPSRLGAGALARLPVSPDGQGFLVIDFGTGADGDAPSPQIITVQNGFEELRRLVPTN